MRHVWFEGTSPERPVHASGTLAVGSTVTGPAIIEEPTTTIVLPDGRRAPHATRSLPRGGGAVSAEPFDRVDLAVMANRFDGIVREMENTLLRTARSSVIGLCRDFSCSIVSTGDELVASAEGLPVHVYGSGLVSRVMRTLHPDLAEGDAFLHNDPYDGDTHTRPTTRSSSPCSSRVSTGSPAS